MKKCWLFFLPLFLVFGIMPFPATAAAGEQSRFGWTDAPPRGSYIAVTLGYYSLTKYLADCQVNRPEIINEVQQAIAQGNYYRKLVDDQKGRPTTLTVSVDTGYSLRIVTHRDDACPKCNGTGIMKSPLERVTSHIDINLNCIGCKGTGIIPDNTVEKYYILSSEDFENPEQGRVIMAQRAYSGAPSGAEAWVERLASQNPQERLAACEWLDRNYIKVGMNFQDVMPMLKKARFYDSNDKRKIMVWQFWAGKDIPGQAQRAYYRIYVDSRSGKISKKEFASGR